MKDWLYGYSQREAFFNSDRINGTLSANWPELYRAAVAERYFNTRSWDSSRRRGNLAYLAWLVHTLYQEGRDISKGSNHNKTPFRVALSTPLVRGPCWTDWTLLILGYCEPPMELSSRGLWSTYWNISACYVPPHWILITKDHCRGRYRKLIPCQGLPFKLSCHWTYGYGAGTSEARDHTLM